MIITDGRIHYISFELLQQFPVMLKMKQFFIILSLIIANQTIMGQNTEKITLGMGCFWCGEAVYSRIDGVLSVTSGYSGGETENPTYREVTQGTTGYAEVIQIEYNPQIISFRDILSIFWEMHNPTTLNRQGADMGTQYRSAIFYHTEAQKRIAKAQIELLTKEKYFDDPIVTEIIEMEIFYPAEDYHQDFYNNNKLNGYCQFIIGPKLKKLQKLFKENIK
ncbi:MAG: peptide-methionine (S)-S-oxide reductase MsrA [Bacteroidota bacterium]|nr:peptide-methionine (S)-S-oxide reductase MsrA [Bacteroidota bacterium]